SERQAIGVGRARAGSGRPLHGSPRRNASQSDHPSLLSAAPCHRQTEEARAHRVHAKTVDHPQRNDADADDMAAAPELGLRLTRETVANAFTVPTEANLDRTYCRFCRAARRFGGLFGCAIRGAISSEPLVAKSSYQTLQMFAFVFGIPLSFAALLTAVLLGLGTRW